MIHCIPNGIALHAVKSRWRNTLKGPGILHRLAAHVLIAGLPLSPRLGGSSLYALRQELPVAQGCCFSFQERLGGWALIHENVAFDARSQKTTLTTHVLLIGLPCWAHGPSSGPEGSEGPEGRMATCKRLEEGFWPPSFALINALMRVDPYLLSCLKICHTASRLFWLAGFESKGPS